MASVMTSRAIGPSCRVGDAACGVTIEAPAHRERRRLLDLVHLGDCAVTLLAGDLRQQMPAVIEVDEIRKVVHLDPADRPLLQHRFAEFLQLSRLPGEQRVTVHADVGGRNPGMPALSCAGVAIEAGHFRLPRVQAMGERNGLSRAVSLIDADASESTCGQRG